MTISPAALARALNKPRSTISRLLRREPALATARDVDNSPRFTPDDVPAVRAALKIPAPEIPSPPMTHLQLAQKYQVPVAIIDEVVCHLGLGGGNELNGYAVKKFTAYADHFCHGWPGSPANDRAAVDARKAAEAVAGQKEMARLQKFAREHGYCEGDEPGRLRHEAAEKLKADAAANPDPVIRGLTRRRPPIAGLA